MTDRHVLHATFTLQPGDELATVSLTTIQFRPAAEGTELVLTEQGTFPRRLRGSELARRGYQEPAGRSGR
jgi:hypothetical protein